MEDVNHGVQQSNGLDLHCPKQEALATCDYLNLKSNEIEFLSYNCHISKAQQLHVVSGYNIKQHRFRTFLMSIIAENSVGQCCSG